MPAKVITVFNQKGGVGKTNVTMQTAGTLGNRGKRVKIIDADPQATATRWHAQADENRPFPARISNLSGLGGVVHREIRADIDNFDYIFVDCPPAIESPIPGSALLVSDLAVIPVVAAPSDLWAVVAAKRLVEQAQGTNPTLKAVVVLNMFQENTALARGAQRSLADDAVPPLKSTLGLRSAFRECQLAGTTVHGVPRSKAAREEVDALVNEILKHAR